MVAETFHLLDEALRADLEIKTILAAESVHLGVRDRLLARCAFAEDLKPRQIIKAYPSRWKDEREVSIELYRIRRLLRNDPELRRLIG